MKLTRAGADYHAAILLLLVVGLVSGGTLFAALALALAFASLFSLVLARLRLPKYVVVQVASGPVRVLKGEEGKMALSIPGFRDPWATVRVEAVRVAGPVKTSPASEVAGGLEFAVRPILAGRFTQAEVVLGLGDPLGLFYSTRRIALDDAVIDSLPRSLVAPVRRAIVPPLVVGESPAGTAGKGQEFYGIEEYTRHSESKDILWSRAAKEPDRPLLARVREASGPESVTIEVVHGAISADTKPVLVDLQCEALGTIGRALVLAGIRVEITAPDGTTFAAEDDEELAEAIMRTSASGRPTSNQDSGRWPRILMLVGDRQQDSMLSDSRLPTVLVGLGVPRILDRYVTAYSGTEDLSGLLAMVLSG
ncbi:MAG: hypothetical protein JRN06_01995 [Nitrososphaerota archaeon]|nr:hypothetical protein [Nitrososphaerota archaeon]MDG7023373.1 hypothetical protein [Nitrososphaerota archaeon]